MHAIWAADRERALNVDPRIDVIPRAIQILEGLPTICYRELARPRDDIRRLEVLAIAAKREILAPKLISSLYEELQ